MNFYRNSKISSEELFGAVRVELRNYYANKLMIVIEDVLLAQANNDILDFSGIEKFIVDMCDNECISLEQIEAYDPEANKYKGM